MSECEHMSFDASVVLNRIEDVQAFSADITIRCTKCGMAFRFLGLPAGIDINYPTVSIDGTEARLPIAPGSLFDEQ